LSRTVAVIVEVEVPLAIIVAGAAETVTLPPARPPVMVSVILADLVPAVAVTSTVVFVGELAVNVAVAYPPEVNAEGVIEALSGSLNEKETWVPSAMEFPEASTTRAVMVEVPFTKTEVGLAERLTAAGDVWAVTVTFTELVYIVPLTVTTAVIVTVPGLPLAVNVTDAMPLVVVVAILLFSTP
jgi:hypothetical protein